MAFAATTISVPKQPGCCSSPTSAHRSTLLRHGRPRGRYPHGSQITAILLGDMVWSASLMQGGFLLYIFYDAATWAGRAAGHQPAPCRPPAVAGPPPRARCLLQGLPGQQPCRPGAVCRTGGGTGDALTGVSKGPTTKKIVSRSSGRTWPLLARQMTRSKPVKAAREATRQTTPTPGSGPTASRRTSQLGL